MFSKLTMSLAVTMSLLLADSTYAQQKQKADAKKTAATAQAKQAEEARVAELAAKKAEEDKALEAKRIAEAEAAAAKAKALDSAGVYGYVKSHFSASYHGEYSFARKYIKSANEADHDIQDLKIMHNPTVIYRPVTNLKFLVTSEFKYTDAETKGSFINQHYRSLVMLTRENVLTEKEHGVKMDLSVARRIFARPHTVKTYGNTRFNASLSKKVNDKLSTSMLVQYLANDPSYKLIDGNTWKHSVELIPSFTWQITDKLSYFFNDDFILNTPFISNKDRNLSFSHEMNIGVLSYQFNDKNSAYFQFKYNRNPRSAFTGGQNLGETFDYYIGHTYAFTPKLSLTSEIGSTMFAARDGRKFFANDIKYPEFYLYLDFSL